MYNLIGSGYIMHFREIKKVLEKHGELCWIEHSNGWYGLLDTGDREFNVYEMPSSTEVFRQLYDDLYTCLWDECNQIESRR